MGRRALIALVLVGFAAPVASAQAPPGRGDSLLARAWDCLHSVPSDSVPERCTGLVRQLHDPGTGASVANRAVGYVLLAAIHLREDEPEEARNRLRAALLLDATQTRHSLEELHPDLVALAELEWHTWMSRDTTSPSDSAVNQAAAMVGRRPPWYPRSVVARRLTGEVHLQVVVDTLGRVEPGLIRIASSSDTAFEWSAVEFAIAARFRPARRRDRPVRFAGLLQVVFDDPAVSEMEADDKPKLIGGGPPGYPYELVQRGIEGRVVLEFIVDSIGRVDRQTIYVMRSPDPGLARAAVSFIRSAKFRPARLGGRPVRAIVRQPMDYGLGNPVTIRVP